MVRKARIVDSERIQEIVNFYAQKDLMLPLSLNEVYERLRDFSVYSETVRWNSTGQRPVLAKGRYEEDGEVAGCVALHISWSALAEVRSLAVSEKRQDEGIGKRLLLASIEEAKILEIPRVFTLTRIPSFFEKYGFKKIDKAELPHKIWADCLKCPKFPNCDEVALILKIGEK